MKKTLLTLMTVGLFAACGTKAPELTSGIDFANMDTTASPVEDFYQYATGGWCASHPLDSVHSRYGSFDKLGEDNNEMVNKLIDSISKAQNEKGSTGYQIATLYNLGMDSAKLEEQGVAPIQPYLEQIAKLNNREDYYQQMMTFHKMGLFTFFGLFGESDPDNSANCIAWFYQGGLGLGDRDYYLDAKFKSIQEAYVSTITEMLTLTGYDKIAAQPADKLAKMAMKVETRLAKAQYTKEVNRDPNATCHKMAAEEADKVAPNVRFADYLQFMGLDNKATFNLAQPEYFTEVGKMLATEDLESLKAYMAWQLANDLSSYLNDAVYMCSFNFYGKTLSGQPNPRPRWKRVTSVCNNALGEALGQLYVAAYFPPEAKERMIQLVNNLKEAFAMRIDQASWMSPATKEKGKEKLAAILVKVGYPDTWRDYSGLKIENDSYVANIIRSNIFDMEYSLSKINKPVDRNEWLMTPQTVNAYYNPTTNEICFPAAILMPPFFDMHADDAINYGGIGVVIGHEMTHGFDDKGHLYDKEGNLNSWWTDEDAANFENNAKVLVDWFNQVKVSDDPLTYANGTLCLGENIADNGGLHISYQAMLNAIEKGQVNREVMDGFTPAQRFFLNYALIWASNIRPEEALRLTQIDVHSLCRNRVNATLPHVTEFIEAFDVKPGDGMYLEPEKRVTLW